MKQSAFELLGIGEKELPVSNLLANYLNPQINHQYAYTFLNELCKLAGLAPINDTEPIFIEREHHIFYENYHNYIDILIYVSSKEHPTRIICIENKINSVEGICQTRRYYHALEQEFYGCPIREYIYLTKNNSSVNLSSNHFVHLRYAQLGKLFETEGLMNLPLAKDFYDYYIQRERTQFQLIDLEDHALDQADQTDYNQFIQYLVWKINNPDDFSTYPDVFVVHETSAHANDHFYKIAKQNWQLVLNNVSMSIHLEGYANIIYLHFEVEPYAPMKVILKNHGEAFYKNYMAKRDELLDILSEHTELPVKKNAYLQIAKFRIDQPSYKSYFSALMKLLSKVDEILLNAHVIE